MPHPTNINYIGHQAASSDFTPSPTRGGTVLMFAADGALNVGDAVRMTGEDTVGKGTTNPTKAVGIVVGGALLPNYLVEYGGAVASTLISAGIAATNAAGQFVYVLVFGVTEVVCDGVIANGGLIKISAAGAGKVTAAVASVDAGAVLGKLIGLASAVDGDVRRALISLM